LIASSVFGRELLEIAVRPRATAIKLVFPLVLGLPLLLSPAPPFYAAMAITMLAATVGSLGPSAVLARERGGLQLRYRLLPLRAGRVLAERLAAGALIDLAQLAPVLALIAIRHPGGAAWWPALVLATLGTLLCASVLGALASAFTSSPGEVMLYVFIPLLPAFYLAGLFVPPSGAGWRAVAAVLPISHLHEALAGALGGRALENPAAAALAGAVFVLAGLAAAYAAGRRVLEAE
jgi:ABC-2 family transporter